MTAELHTFSEARRGGDHIDWPEHVAGVAESVRHSVYSANLKFDAFTADLKSHFQLYASGQYITRNSYYGGIGEPKAKDKDGNEVLVGGKTVPAGRLGYPIHSSDYGTNYGVTRGLTAVVGGQYTYDFERLFFMPAQLLAGVEYSYDRLHDEMPLRGWTTEKSNADGYDPSSNPVALSPALHQVIKNASQFAQLEWKNDRWSILLGTRLDENSAVKKAIFSPRATLRFNPTKNINLRATYAKGFRAPQVFDEDLHVGVVNGEAQKVVNADDLRPEVSHSFSLSNDMYFRVGQTHLNILLEGFYTRLLDVFTNYKTGTRDGITYFTRHNYGIDDQGKQVASGAKILGVNLEGKLSYSWLSLQGGLTLTSNKYDVAQEWGVRSKVKEDISDAAYMSYVPKADGSSFDPVAQDDEVQTVSMTSKEIMRTPSAYGLLHHRHQPHQAPQYRTDGDLHGLDVRPTRRQVGAELCRHRPPGDRCRPAHRGLSARPHRCSGQAHHGWHCPQEGRRRLERADPLPVLLRPRDEGQLRPPPLQEQGAALHGHQQPLQLLPERLRLRSQS